MTEPERGGNEGGGGEEGSSSINNPATQPPGSVEVNLPDPPIGNPLNRERESEGESLVEGPTTGSRNPFVWPSRPPNENSPFPIPIREFFGLGPRVPNTGIERFANMSGSMLLEYTDYLTGRSGERERLRWQDEVPMVAGPSVPSPNPPPRASGGEPLGGSGRESLVLDIESGLNGWELSPPPESGTRPDGTNPPTPGGESAAGSPTHGDRSPAEILRDSPETRAVINEINRYTTVRPFLIIMILKGLIDHGSGIVCFLAMLVTFSHSNSLLKKEVSKQRKRNLLFLAMITINLLVCASFMYYVFSEEELYTAIIFMPTKVEPTGFWILMWVVGITDHVAKFLAVISKALIVALPPAVLPFQKRGKYYLFIEQSSQLYRSFLPIPHWFTYLLLSYEGGAKMFGMILAGMYVMFKAQDSIQRLKDWHSAFTKLLQNVHYGTTPTSKEMDETGPNCPICHDSFSSPTRLSCSHIFCEECVATWFDRERTCPICRAKVVDDPSFRDGSTAMYIQLF